MPASFSINHRAQFPVPVVFTTPAGEAAKITFQCNHLKMSEILAAEKPVTDHLMAYDGPNFQLAMAEAHAGVIREFATGWDALEEFNHANISAALDLYPTLYGAFASAYRSALVGDREKS